MNFTVVDVKVTLKVDSSLSKASILLRSMYFKSWGEEALLELENIIVQIEKVCQRTLDIISKVLTDFASVFETPKSLLPLRGHNHAINLHPSSALVSPHFQKSKIECLVRETLATGRYNKELVLFQARYY